MHLDRLYGYEQRLRDLGVRRALSCEGGDPTFAGSERISTGEPVPSYPYAAGCELLACSVSQPVSSALASELIAGAERFSRVASLTRAALSASEVNERASVFESPRRAFEVFDGSEQLFDDTAPISGEATARSAVVPEPARAAVRFGGGTEPDDRVGALRRRSEQWSCHL